MALLTALIAGLLFGIGLTLGGMLDPSKVTGFLNLFGVWDPSLAFVMGGGVIVNAIGFFWVKKKTYKPMFNEGFSLPSSVSIDKPLLIGSALFGIGWGIGGLCPGPALASMFLNPSDGIGFFAFMIAGLVLGRVIGRRIA